MTLQVVLKNKGLKKSFQTVTPFLLVLLLLLNFSLNKSNAASNTNGIIFDPRVQNEKIKCEKKWENFFLTHPSTILPEELHAFVGHCDQSLKSLMKLKMATNTNNNYTNSRIEMFLHIDNNHNRVCCVYSGKCYDSINTMPKDSLLNCEHTWPQSLGARGVAKSDLHHLFPVNSSINSLRGNLPFCNVEKVLWKNSEQDVKAYLGFNKKGVKCFEPPSFHKGNVARAVFYFSARYEQELNNDEEATLRKWSDEDPVDTNEIHRSDLIESYQHNRNLFIDYPWLSEFITNF